MFDISQEDYSDYSFLSLFSGAGGLDIGFEKAGFRHIQSSDILDCAIQTLRRNRPNWDIVQADIREYEPNTCTFPDVLLAGFPCQGFSLGGHRNANDNRNQLYMEAIRIATLCKPRVIVFENVLNLRTMKHPISGLPFAEQICQDLSAIGYNTKYKSFRVSEYGVPQTRRRFIFIAHRKEIKDNFFFPSPTPETSARKFLFDLANDATVILPNHAPKWGFRSKVHTETGKIYSSCEAAIPVRLSRTASDGNPIRSYDTPFPAVDTATIWGWAVGNVTAEKIIKNRHCQSESFIRDPNSTAKLWRITASKLREFTPREYARLQTFPDNWEFIGKTKRDFHLQIGNAVPAVFAKNIAQCIRESLEGIDGIRPLRKVHPPTVQLQLF